MNLKCVIILVTLLILSLCVESVSAYEIGCPRTTRLTRDTEFLSRAMIRLSRRMQLQIEHTILSRVIIVAKQSKFHTKDLSTPTNLSGKHLDKALKGTGLEGLGDAFAKAEKETGVSALFLVGLAAHESAWGTSRFAKERNNLFGWNANTNSPGDAVRFESKEEAIREVSEALKSNYLTEGGRFHKGYTLQSVNHFYASDPNWHRGIARIMTRLALRLECRLAEVEKFLRR